MGARARARSFIFIPPGIGSSRQSDTIPVGEVYRAMVHRKAGFMKDCNGMTIVELVVLFSIIALLLLIGVPKVMDGFTKSKMRDDGVNTLNVLEARELECFARLNRLVPLDSEVRSPHIASSEYFTFRCDGIGRFTAIARKPIGSFKKGSWMSTTIQINGGIPQITRSCSPGDTSFVRRYVDNFF
jgi:type II secretory pathway pseudopilin PulG